MASGDDAQSDFRRVLPDPVGELPADLVAVVVLVVAAVLAVVLPWVSETPLRVILGLPFVLFVPGYAFIAALFPEAGEPPTGGVDADSSRRGRRGIDGIERFALSVGLSIATVALIGLGLNFSPWGIRLVPILVGVSGFTLVATGVGAARRRELPPEDRFRVPYRAWIAAGRGELLEPDSRGDAVLNLLLVVSVLLATASVGYAVAVPTSGESFTELYLLTEEDGELVAEDYPTTFTRGESRELVVGIANHERRTIRYGVVVLLQQVSVTRTGARVDDSTDETGNVSITVLEERELRRFGPRLGHDRTWTSKHSVAPGMTGDRLRLTYLLYDGSPPPDPSIENAYRAVYLWVNVSEPSG